MKENKEWGKGRIPNVTYNPKLDALEGKVLFPEKLERAKKELKGVKLPPHPDLPKS